MKKLRLALAGAALTAAVAPLASAPADAMACHPDFQKVCAVIGLACQTIDDHSKLECPPMG